MDPRITILAINNVLSSFLVKGKGGDFLLTQFKPNIYRLAPSNSSEAKNYYHNDVNTVQVEKWFNRYWLFVQIAFPNPNQTIISISIFQGENNDPEKSQLFRAEWDDYGDNTMNHPQPHWHFLTNKKLEENFSTFKEFLAEESTNGFLDLLDGQEKQEIDLSKFHFAMNGNWMNSDKHIHRINDEKNLSKWFGGLLAYLKEELEFIDKKMGIT